MKSEFIGAWELAGKTLQTAHNLGKFVMSHLKGGAWGDTATNIQPPHINIEPTLGEE